MNTPSFDLTASDTGRGAEIAEACRDRAATYALLARLYRVEIDAELLESLRALRFPTTGDEGFDQGARAIVGYLAHSDADTLLELSIDYVRTFIGHGVDGNGAAFPYESVYTSERRLLMQEARDEVLRCYREAGMDRDASWKEPEDHIALELEFEKVLALRCADAIKAGDLDRGSELLSKQERFLSEHLRVWVPTFTGDMLKFAQTGIYQGLARITNSWVEQDCMYLSGLAR